MTSEATPSYGRPRINPAVVMGKPARQLTLRESNLTTVLSHVFATDEPISRLEIVRLSGITRATVSRIVDQLISARVVRESGRVHDGGLGRPTTLLVPAPATHAALGLEVNTSSIGACVVDLSGTVLAFRVVHADFRDSDPATTLGLVAQLGDEVITESNIADLDIVGAHLSLPGIIDSGSGHLLVAALLGWHDIVPQEVMAGNAQRFDPQQIVLGTVGMMAAKAEAALRQRNGLGSSFLYVSGDNGIGCSLMVDDKPFPSARGWSGQIGHVLVDPAGPVCRCGARGCLDMYAGRSAILEHARIDPNADMGDLLSMDRGDGDPLLQSVERAGDALGVALANYANLMDVDTIVLGDNLAVLFPWIHDPIMRQLELRSGTSRRELPQLKVALTSWNSAMAGGALSVLQDFIENLHERLLA